MSAMTAEQLEAVTESDALCDGCGADPREAEALDGWFVDTVLVGEDRLAVVRCPACW